MPYIKKEDRGEFDKIAGQVSELLKNQEDIDGKLNYLITKILKKVYSQKYSSYNRAIGMIECVKQEFYRRDISSYEDKKIKENGDVE